MSNGTSAIINNKYVTEVYEQKISKQMSAEIIMAKKYMVDRHVANISRTAYIFNNNSDMKQPLTDGMSGATWKRPYWRCEKPYINGTMKRIRNGWLAGAKIT
jgi:hypothetical protein